MVESTSTTLGQPWGKVSGMSKTSGRCWDYNRTLHCFAEFDKGVTFESLRKYYFLVYNHPVWRRVYYWIIGFKASVPVLIGLYPHGYDPCEGQAMVRRPGRGRKLWKLSGIFKIQTFINGVFIMFMKGSAMPCFENENDEWGEWISQQTRNLQPMLVWCWPIVYDAGPTSNQHWLNISCLLDSSAISSDVIWAAVEKQTAVTADMKNK